MRYFFEIRYKGTDYHGWQRQSNAISIQEVVEDCLSMLLSEKISITGSGRTDRGVHCNQQYFHVDVTKPLPNGLIQKINSFLPGAIAIISACPVDDEQHARFDAISRKYRYTIQRTKNPFNEDVSYLFSRPLNMKLMNKAAEHLIGEKDFQCFSKVKTDVHTFICRIVHAAWRVDGEQLLFEIEANRFLRGMVRAIVGTLLDVGLERKTLKDLDSLIKSGDRKRAGAAAPAHGLSLFEVRYPEKYFN